MNNLLVWNADSINPSRCSKQAQVLLGKVIKSSSLTNGFLLLEVSSLYASIFQINTFCNFGVTSDSKLICDWVEMSRSKQIKEGTFLTNKKEIFWILNVFFPPRFASRLHLTMSYSEIWNHFTDWTPPPSFVLPMNIKQGILDPRSYIGIPIFPSLLVIINWLASLWRVHPNHV